jgi:hypothetical protein
MSGGSTMGNTDEWGFHVGGAGGGVSGAEGTLLGIVSIEVDGASPQPGDDVGVIFGAW